MANEYLKRTPTSTGNRSVYTWAGWLKRNKINQDYYLFSSGDDTSNIFYVSVRRDTNNNNLTVLFRDGDTSSHTLVFNNNSFRDPGSWMHLVVAVDTTIVDSKSDRVKIYINGKRLSGWTTDQLANLNQNSLTSTNAQGELHTIGEYSVFNGSYADMQIFDYFLIDGQALTPDVFGFYKDGNGYISVGTTNATDFRPGQWMPHSPTKIKKDINRRGGFGVNGFYLPMNDSSNPGADFHCSPNSIIKLKGEDLPQPRNGAPTTSDAYVSQLRSDPYAANLVLAVPGISTATGINQVVNGNFDSGTTSWTASTGATLTNPEGTLRVTVTQTAGAEQTISGLTVGERYTLSFRLRTDGTNFANQRITINGVASYIGNRTNTIWEQVNYSFTATNSILALYMYKATGGWVEYDDIVLKQEDAPRDYSADIKGSGTNNTPTLSGNSGVGYELGGYYGSAYTSNSNNDYLQFPGTSGDFNVGTGDFTIEMWLNPDSTQTTNARIFGQDGNSAGNWDIYITGTSASNRIRMMGGAESLTGGDGSSYGNLVGDQWNHFCLERYDGQLTTYVNGVAVYTQAYTLSIGDNNTFRIGQIGSNVYGGVGYSFNGEIQDFRFYKGLAKYKGGFDVPKPYTPVGIESWRTVTDTCKNNFATLNPLGTGADLTYSNGNLSSTSGSSATRGPSIATIGVTQAGTEKYYWEFLSSSPGSNNALSGLIGLGPDITDGKYVGFTNQYGIGYYITGQTYIAYGGALTVSSYGATYTDGDIIGVALDMGTNNGTLTFYKNGVSQGVAATGLGAYLTSGAIHAWVPGFGDGSAGQSVTHNVNFGQNPTFCGLVAAGTFTDSNGKGLFKYAPPSGFLALCEDNLPTPAIADPGKHFKTVLYTGDTSNGRSITSVGFQPDLVWLKGRTTAYNNLLVDSVRGAGNILFSDSNSGERGLGISLVNSFNSDGFGVNYFFETSSNASANGNSTNYVAWCWKAGGPAVSNTDGSITSQVSVNQTAGFSIATWTSTGSNDALQTVGHGLNKTPNMIILKNRSAAVNWRVYHSGINDAGKNSVTLNSTEAAYVFWPSVGNDTFGLANSITTGQAAGTSGQDIVAYCWTEIEGFSKFGSYEGNLNADGPFVYCGFKPAVVIIKWADGSASWVIQDSSRTSTNPSTLALIPDSSGVELDASTLSVDFLSNGFKIRNTNGSYNNASTYIFAAWAESPFQTANAK